MLDVPAVVRIACGQLAFRNQVVAGRLQHLAGNMFEAVPPAEVYVLKRIIRDWDDERCLRVLNTCRLSMTAGGRIICVDAILPPMGDTSRSAAEDVCEVLEESRWSLGR